MTLAMENENDLIICTRQELLNVMKEWYHGTDCTAQDALEATDYLIKQLNEGKSE